MRKLVAAFALALLVVPATGHASTRYGAPYASANTYDWCVESQWPVASAFAGTPSATCTLNDHADAATGAMHTEISIQSLGDGAQPGYGEAFGVTSITASVYLAKPSTRPVTISETVRVNRASVRHDGALANVPRGIADVVLFGQVMQTSCGDCDSATAHASVELANLAGATTPVEAQDVTLTFVLKSASGVVPAGTYTTTVVLQNYVCLNGRGPAGERVAQTGTVTAHADAVLTRIVVH